MKNERHNLIIKIIKSQVITTQEQLLAVLMDKGVLVTQATLSRDIKQLGLVKMTDDNGISRYMYNSSGTLQGVHYVSIFKQAVISCDYAMNIVAIKCHPGMANAACTAYENMGFDELPVGTIAGDDTIFILFRSEEKAKEQLERLTAIHEV